MSNESKALGRLGGVLTGAIAMGWISDDEAAELRRQHAEIESLRSQLAQQAHVQGEPMEQWQKKHPIRTHDEWENTSEHDAKWWRDNSNGWVIRVLYTHPQQASEPMTDELARDEYLYRTSGPSGVVAFIAGIRFAERFHKIGEKQ